MKKRIEKMLASIISLRITRARFEDENPQYKTDPNREAQLHYLDGQVDILNQLLETEVKSE